MDFPSVILNKKQADTCKHIHCYAHLHLVIVSGLAVMNSLLTVAICVLSHKFTMILNSFVTKLS